MGRKLDLNPVRMVKRGAERASKVVTIPAGALQRRLEGKPTGDRGRAGGTDQQKQNKAEDALRAAGAERRRLEASPSTFRINPAVRLDTSQVEDRRRAPQLSEEDMMSHADGRRGHVGDTNTQRPYNGPRPEDKGYSAASKATRPVGSVSAGALSQKAMARRMRKGKRG